jgi:hypothetical protein
MDYKLEESPYDRSKVQLFEALLESSRFVGATKRFYLILDNGDKFISVKPGTFEESFIPGEKLTIGIHQDDIHVFKAPRDLLHELSLS